MRSFYVFFISRAVVLPTGWTLGSDAALCVQSHSCRAVQSFPSLLPPGTVALWEYCRRRDGKCGTVPWIVIALQTPSIHIASGQFSKVPQHFSHWGECRPPADGRWNRATVTSGGFLCSLCGVLWIGIFFFVRTASAIANTFSNENLATF